ncbi:MAG: hypothetical protein IJM62_02735 [Lachnospiraceae bacterium]|nr:hypothetical protein [Lachnospiraceae bacterium]
MKERSIKGKTVLGFILLAAAVVFIAVGIMQGEHITIMDRAVRICLECIGIG